jgi:hypothetical protein
MKTADRRSMWTIPLWIGWTLFLLNGGDKVFGFVVSQSVHQSIITTHGIHRYHFYLDKPGLVVITKKNHPSIPLLFSSSTTYPSSSYSSTLSKFQLHAVLDIVGVSSEPIHTAFAYATFGPQPFWLLLIFLPNAKITKQIMGGMGK